MTRNTTPAIRWHRLLPATVISATALIGVSVFGSIAVASADYKDSDFESCMNRNMPTDYCCEHAGGVIRNGACIDPETLKVPSSGVLQQVPDTPPTNVGPRGVFQLPTFKLAS